MSKMLYLSFYDQLTTYETQELEAAMGVKNHNYFIISDFLKHYLELPTKINNFRSWTSHQSPYIKTLPFDLKIRYSWWHVWVEAEDAALFDILLFLDDVFLLIPILLASISQIPKLSSAYSSLHPSSHWSETVSFVLDSIKNSHTQRHHLSLEVRN